jgi:hypothetical protein
VVHHSLLRRIDRAYPTVPAAFFEPRFQVDDTLFCVGGAAYRSASDGSVRIQDHLGHEPGQHVGRDQESTTCLLLCGDRRGDCRLVGNRTSPWIPASRTGADLGDASFSQAIHQVSVAIFVAYEYWTKALYGQGLLLNAAEFATGQRATSGQPFVLANALMCVSFIGRCALVVLIFSPLLWSGKHIIVGTAPAALAGVAIALGWWRLGTSLQAQQVAAALSKHWLLVGVELMFCIGAGLSVFGLAISDTWRRKFDPGSLLLLLWISGTFVFAGFLNWTINARSVLPIVPAAAILLARRINENFKLKHVIFAFAVSAIFALWITQADTDWADSSRLAAQIIHDKEKTETGTLWFQGHWGFQYYMQQLGAHPVDFARTRLQPGDLVVIPQNNAETYKLKKQFMASAELLELPMHQFASTMRWKIGAGFYSATCTSPWEDPFAGKQP